MPCIVSPSQFSPALYWLIDHVKSATAVSRKRGPRISARGEKQKKVNWAKRTPERAHTPVQVAEFCHYWLAFQLALLFKIGMSKFWKEQNLNIIFPTKKYLILLWINIGTQEFQRRSDNNLSYNYERVNILFYYIMYKHLFLGSPFHPPSSEITLHSDLCI